jgi:hypothetical protein
MVDNGRHSLAGLKGENWTLIVNFKSQKAFDHAPGGGQVPLVSAGTGQLQFRFGLATYRHRLYANLSDSFDRCLLLIGASTNAANALPGYRSANLSDLQLKSGGQRQITVKMKKNRNRPPLNSHPGRVMARDLIVGR